MKQTYGGAPTARRIASGEVTLSVRDWGADKSPTLLLVHGYPDCSHVWDAVVAALRAHFHVVVYDVRGAGRSTAPARIRDYALPLLVADMATVIDATSPAQPVHLVGHDWGSIQAWEAVCSERLQGRIASFTSISGPCLDHVGHGIARRFREPSAEGWRRVGRQLARSWYIGAFQLPFLAPAAWRLGLDRAWPGILRRSEGIEQPPAKPTQCRDGALGVNLYRANVLPRLLSPKTRSTNLPVQLVVPRRDPFVTPELLDGIEQWAPNCRREEIDAGHWVPLSHPQLLAGLIGRFVAEIETTPAARPAAG
jgi:pimeloyl-ACP methyl ester carboxylesterase